MAHVGQKGALGLVRLFGREDIHSFGEVLAIVDIVKLILEPFKNVDLFWPDADFHQVADTLDDDLRCRDDPRSPAGVDLDADDIIGIEESLPGIDCSAFAGQ